MKPERTSIRTDRRRDASERGFALLVVFLVAAGILIALYMEIPRVAFESQRHLEQTLIDRGEQYSRAVEVFYRKTKRYPQKIEELESYNNQRFLRRRYLDPMTGKDDWRLLHMGPNGQISDSLIPKATPNGLNGASGATGASGQTGTNGSSFGTPINGDQTTAGASGQTGGTGDVNVAMTRIRASDRGPGGRGQPGAGNGAYDPNNPNGQQPQYDANGNPISDPNAVANNNPGFNPSNNPGFTPVGQPGGYNQPGQPGYNPSLPPSYPNQSGINPNGVQPGNGGPNVLGQNTPNYGANGQYPTGQDPTQSGNPALNAINNQLRNPGSAFNAPSGALGATGATGATSGFGGALPTTTQTGGQTFGGGGIAGVASVQPGIGIKLYNERKKYKEWEFVYDYTKAKTAIPVPGNPMGTNGASGSTGGTSTSGFGSSSSGFGQSGFGSSTSTTTTPPPPPPNQPPPNQ